MKFLHLADLHLGKSINGVNLIESGDQIDWVEKLLKQIPDISPDAVVIAGDVYDRSAPADKAVALLDRLLTGIAEQNIPVLIIAGNHDSGQRLSFGGSLLAKQNVHIAGVPARKLTCVTIKGVHFWLMPYLFPLQIAQLLEDESIRDYDTAVRRLLAEQEIDYSCPNVLVAHQNVVENGKEAQRGGSESMIGGVGEIDYTAFEGFDYVALGHIHSSYSVGRETVRYAGTPMCYHFNETKQPRKGPLMVEISDTGRTPIITPVYIDSLHPMREVKGTWDEVRKDAETTARHDEYLRVIITDQKLEPSDIDTLRGLYEKRGSLIMESCSEYQAYAAGYELRSVSSEQKPLEELFAGFFQDHFKSDPADEDSELFRFIGELVRNTPNTELSERPDEPDEQELVKLRKFMNDQEVQA